MVSRRSSRSKSPRASRSKTRSMSTKRRSSGRKSTRTASPFLKFRKAHSAAIKKEMKARGLTGIGANTKVAKEMYLASGGQMAGSKTRRARTPSPIRARRASAKAKLAAGASPSLEQKLRTLFSRGSPSAYSPSGRFMGSRKTRKSTKKTRKSAKSPRKGNAYTKWVHEHKAMLVSEFRAAHGGKFMIGGFAKFAHKKFLEANPNYKPKSKMAKSPRKTMRKSRKSKKTMRKSRKSTRKSRKTMRKSRKSRATRKTRGTRKAGEYAKYIHDHKAAIKAAHPGMNFMKAATLYRKSHM